MKGVLVFHGSDQAAPREQTVACAMYVFALSDWQRRSKVFDHFTAKSCGKPMIHVEIDLLPYPTYGPVPKQELGPSHVEATEGVDFSRT